MDITAVSYMNTPIGPLEIRGSEEGIHSLIFSEEEKKHPPFAVPPCLKECVLQLEEYFAGTRKIFSIPLVLLGSDFEKKIWTQLCNIPYGETRTYKQLARDAGSPAGYRAVGLANGKNPISIIVPCHRVIGSEGNLTGYAYGLHRKKWLLDFENTTQLNLF